MIRILVCLLFLSAVVSGQARPEFEVASVRPSTEQTTQVNVGLGISGSQVRISSMSLKDYIGIAYVVRPNQVEGPEWLGRLRFDIAAKIPEGVSAEQVPTMLQSLLIDRFQMKMHRETKEFPVYALGVARDGLKIQALPADAEVASGTAPVTVGASGNGAGVNVDLGGGSSFSFASNRLEARRITMEALADLLTRFLDRPVVDATGLTGRYDLTLDIAPEDYTVMLIRAAVNGGVQMPPQALRMLDGASGNPLADPLQKAGLTLEGRRASLDVLVIDAMARTPTEN